MQTVYADLIKTLSTFFIFLTHFSWKRLDVLFRHIKIDCNMYEYFRVQLMFGLMTFVLNDTSGFSYEDDLFSELNLVKSQTSQHWMPHCYHFACTAAESAWFCHTHVSVHLITRVSLPLCVLQDSFWKRDAKPAHLILSVGLAEKATLWKNIIPISAGANIAQSATKIVRPLHFFVCDVTKQVLCSYNDKFGCVLNLQMNQ